MKRFPTAVPGLDEILHGGLFEGGVYILEGPPGVGKTTLANQIAFARAEAGGKALYVTMLAESHSRMLQHMLGQSFCRPEAVNSSIFYLSGYRELEQDGLKAVVQLLRGEIARHKVDLLVVDGLVVENRAVHSEESIRQFVHELQSLASVMGCTCLLLTSGNGRPLNAEQTMVDGIFEFEDYVYQWRAERRIHVRKFRGSAVERGKHTFCITDDGLRFFPRLEGLPLVERPAPCAASPVPTGIATLDEALPTGGFLAGSTTLLIGESGVGKTLVALAFAARASLEARGLVLAGTESAAELVRIGQVFGLPMAEGIDSGAVEVQSRVQEDESLDEIGHKLLRLVQELDSRRLVVDGLAGLADTVAFRERGYRFMGRLLRELKQHGVTSMFTVDSDALAMASGAPLAEGLCAWFDNVLELTRTPGQAEARTLVIRKMRGTGVARSSFELRLDASGLVVA
jgi:circadian clock protein KaiC